MSKSESRDSDTAAPGQFARQLLAWHRLNGRRNLPWLGSRDPYRVWLSEIMLQQTQVTTVLPYFERFLRRFANLGALASAPVEQVMAAWAGLGYYARARNLHACARALVELHGGRFPRSAADLAKLPGIGRSTAGAIAAFCYGERAPVLDGNVRRVLARHWAIEGDPQSARTSARLWERACLELPGEAMMARYTQAIMDLGSTVCTRAQPACDCCPVKASCQARRTGTTAEFPAARRRPERPVRRRYALVAVAGGAVLLQRRPADGIWGGLLCLPEFGSKAALARCARSLVTGSNALVALAPRLHALTHLTLAIEPYLTLAPAGAHARSGRASHWAALDQIDQAGLPAPHRALLREVNEKLGAQTRSGRIAGNRRRSEERPK